MIQDLSRRLDKLEQKEAHDFDELIKSIEALQVQIEEISAKITKPEFLPVKKSSYQLKLAAWDDLRLIKPLKQLKEYECYTGTSSDYKCNTTHEVNLNINSSASQI